MNSLNRSDNAQSQSRRRQAMSPVPVLAAVQHVRTPEEEAQASIMAQSNRRLLKRTGYPILNGDISTWKEKSSDFLCSVCFEMLNEAQVTRCGHTFCRACILSSIETNHKCPQCSAALEVEHLAPNYALVHLIAKQTTSKQVRMEMLESQITTPPQTSEVNTFLQTDYNHLNLNDVNILLSMLQHKKEALTVESTEHQHALTKSFLSQLLKEKIAEKQILDRAVALIERDLFHVEIQNPAMIGNDSKSAASSYSPSDESSYLDSSPDTVGFNDSRMPCLQFEQATLPARKRRMANHYSDLRKIYFDVRKAVTADVLNNDGMVPMAHDAYEDASQLREFGQTLARVTRYCSFKPLATLSYSADLLSTSNIVSSIEFDKDNEYFAIAGVTKKIKLFEYANVIGSSVDIHCPTSELSCGAKISCVAWSSYYKNYLASSDYDGCVTQWDTVNSTKIRSYKEHEKRVWSVDWSNGDPRLLASGSDDSKVKLWSTTTDKSVANLEVKANVCCVKFCPENTYRLAFGSADHCIHYYDFRSLREPLGIMYGHKKAVSYVKFASKNELVSASTDSNLKLWDLEKKDEIRSFQGHVNEKNFVGLATDGNYIACGSENNSLYIYYKSISKSLFSFTFDNHRSMLERPKADESTEFVSAVAWKKGSPIVVAANSQGAIKVLQLV